MRVYDITEESYNDINIESRKLLREFMEEMKKIYKEKARALICELHIQSGSVIGSGGDSWKLLDTLYEELC